MMMMMMRFVWKALSDLAQGNLRVAESWDSGGSPKSVFFLVHPLRMPSQVYDNQSLSLGPLLCHAQRQVVCGTMGMPTATIQMKGPDGITRMGVGVGTGEFAPCLLLLESTPSRVSTAPVIPRHPPRHSRHSFSLLCRRPR